MLYYDHHVYLASLDETLGRFRLCSTTDNASGYGPEDWGFEFLQRHMLETYKKKNRPWFYKPELSWRWSPISFGGDEYQRRTLVIGFPWTGQMVIPSRKPYDVWFDKQSNMLYIYLTTKEPVYILKTKPSEDGQINLDYSKDDNTLVGIEIFLDDIKEK